MHVFHGSFLLGLMLVAAPAVACEPPVPSATLVGDLGSPALVCPGEVLTFDGSASASGDGGTITAYLWDFGDGAGGSGPVVEHAFGAPGAYSVTLTVQQGNDCESTIPATLEIWVSPEVDFSIMASAMPTNVCLGDTLWLNGWAGTNTGHWSSLLSGGADWDSPMSIPDLDGAPVPFTDTLTFTQFEPGATVASAADVAGVCVSMEHSSMGDLQIRLTCPNGQTVKMHQLGGGGTYLGGARDVQGYMDTIPGDCWTYCWTPVAEWGTFVDHAANGPEPNVMTGGIPPQDALIPGNYSPNESFSGLAGCPLNGAWVLSIEDLWSIDNGFICDWWIDFVPGLSDEVVQFSPSVGFHDPDSAHWAGTGIPSDDPIPAEGPAVPTDPGAQDYTFTVVNSFGCTFSTTLTVQVDAIPDQVLITGDSATCGQDLVTLAAPEGFDSYEWGPGLGLGLEAEVGPGIYTVTVTQGTCVAGSEPFEVVQTGPAETPTIVWQDMALVSSEAPAYQWFLDDAPILGAIDQTHEPLANGLYAVEITDANGCRAKSDPYTFTTLGVHAASDHGVTLHPQPARDMLLLSGAQTGSVYRLYDMGGQLMLEGLVTGKLHPIQVGTLAAGLYVLELRQGQSARRWPVMVE